MCGDVFPLLLLMRFERGEMLVFAQKRKSSSVNHSLVAETYFIFPLPALLLFVTVLIASLM